MDLTTNSFGPSTDLWRAYSAACQPHAATGAERRALALAIAAGWREEADHYHPTSRAAERATRAAERWRRIADTHGLTGADRALDHY